MKVFRRVGDGPGRAQARFQRQPSAIHLGRLIPKRVEALGAEDRSALAEVVLAEANPADTPVVIDLAFARASLVRSDPQRPLYQQLADIIRKIQAAHRGVRLPTERRLAREIKMARVTVPRLWRIWSVRGSSNAGGEREPIRLRIGKATLGIKVEQPLKAAFADGAGADPV